MTSFDPRQTSQIVRNPRVFSTSEGSLLLRTRVKNFSDFPNTLLCVTWDGTTEGTDQFHVAKPYGLRRTPFHGQTVDGIAYTFTGNLNRTGSKSGLPTEKQVIIPGYFLNDELWAWTSVIGGTGADVEGIGKIGLLDANIRARAWAAESSDAAAAAIAAADPRVKHNFGASTDPTVDDDSDAGYGKGSRWVNATANTHFVLVDPSPGAAIWLQTSSDILLYPLDGSRSMTGTVNLQAFTGTRLFSLGGLIAGAMGAAPSAVNYLAMFAASTGVAALLQALGGDANIGIRIAPLGTGKIILDGDVDLNATNRFFYDSNGNVVVLFTGGSSAINYLRFVSSPAAAAVVIEALGSDASIDVNIKPKGLGKLLANGFAVYARPSNFTATTAPTATDDVTEGYRVGSFWYDITNTAAYVCIDATEDAAIWIRFGRIVTISQMFRLDAPTADDLFQMLNVGPDAGVITRVSYKTDAGTSDFNLRIRDESKPDDATGQTTVFSSDKQATSTWVDITSGFAVTAVAARQWLVLDTSALSAATRLILKVEITVT